MPETQEQEWRRLTEAYGEMYDEELLDLAASLNDLTETAKTVLRDELRKRGLGDPLAPTNAPPINKDAEPSTRRTAKIYWESHGHRDNQSRIETDQDEPREFTWKTLLCECNTTLEAQQLAEALQLAGIDSWIETSGRARWDLNGPRVLVAADQLDQAQAVAAQPIPQEIIDESREEVSEFKPPVCPRCGASDPVLLPAKELSIGDPKPKDDEWVNSWECESCGNEWSDPVVDPSEAR
jgi:hypothetical protein